MTPEAEADLEKLWSSDNAAAADLTVLVEELRDNQVTLAAMHVHQRMEGRVHISRLLEMRARRLDLWRLKVYELDDPKQIVPYRIVYAYDNANKIYYIIAYMHRSVDYERDPEFSRRIQNAYKNLGIPEL